MEPCKMFTKVFVIWLPTFLFGSIVVSTIADNGASTEILKALLQTTTNTVNESLSEHYTVMQENTDTSISLITSIDDRVAAFLHEERKLISKLTNVLTALAEEVAVLGRAYSHCTMAEDAVVVISQYSATALKTCSDPTVQFLDAYDILMNEFIAKTQAVNQHAYRQVLECLPETETPTNDKINEAVNCLNSEQINFHSAFVSLEQTLISNQDSYEQITENLSSKAKLCIDSTMDVVEDYSKELIYKTLICATENPQNSWNEKVAMDDLQNEIDEANVTLTNMYEKLSVYLTEVMDSDMIADVITETAAMISGANETIMRMSNSTFNVIDEIEANGSYPQCLEGVREKAQDILDQATRNLPYCVVALQELDQEYDEELTELLVSLEDEGESAEYSVLLCVPSGDEVTEEEILEAIDCVVSAKLEAVEAFTSLQNTLLSVVEEAVDSLDSETVDARRCVDTATHVAGDQTGYLRFLLDQCIASSEPSTTETFPKVTMEELLESLDRAQVTLRHEWSHLEAETEDAFNDQSIPSSISKTEDLISRVEEAFVNMGQRVADMINAADEKNFTDCTDGLWDEVVNRLTYSQQINQGCLKPLSNIANTYEKEVVYFMEQSAIMKELMFKKVLDCLPSYSFSSSFEIEQAMHCVESEKVNGLESLTFQEEKLATLVEKSNELVDQLNAAAEACAAEEKDSALSETEELIHDIEACMKKLRDI